LIAKKSGLGKTLGTIFVENGLYKEDQTVTLSLSDIVTNKFQPRKDFNDTTLKDLSESILKNGLLQPIIVRSFGSNKYQIVAGERRFKACKMAGIKEISATIIKANDAKTTLLALIENLQRENLNPIEEAEGFQILLKKYNLTQEEVSKEVGRSRSAISNAIRILSLPEKVVEATRKGKLSVGHAKVLLSLKDKEKILNATKITLEKGLSTRDLEKFCKNDNKNKMLKTKKPSFIDEIETMLYKSLKRRVKILIFSSGGALQINFKDQEDLSELVQYFGL
jgi:ParB family chromosome partitioning protein